MGERKGNPGKGGKEKYRETKKSIKIATKRVTWNHLYSYILVLTFFFFLSLACGKVKVKSEDVTI